MNGGLVNKLPAWRSLSTRVALFTLASFVVSIWLVAFVASRILLADLQRQLGEQQFSTATLVAQELNNDLIERFTALQSVGAKITPAMLADTAVLQAFLEDREVFQSLFNAGTFVTTLDGTATASVPLAAQRSGLNYMYRDHIAAALKEGVPGVSQPIVGKALKVPVISLAVPLRDGAGQVMGALVGVIDLTKPSFLSRISDNRYGQTGGYFVVDRRVRQIVTASDKSRILELLPARVSVLPMTWPSRAMSRPRFIPTHAVSRYWGRPGACRWPIGMWASPCQPTRHLHRSRTCSGAWCR